MAQARPYYAAMKGISCSTCHLNPAGAGVRRASEGTPTFLNNAFTIGVDLRGSYVNDTHPLNDFSFKTLEQRIYLMAEPMDSLFLGYSNESGSTAEAYGMATKEEWFDAYARFGRFFLPYGLQVSDPDNSSFIKSSPFAPKGAGFSLQAGVTDVGVEVGLAPKKKYFANLSVTNGSNRTGSGSAKAVTGRGGLIFENASVGVTGFQSAVPSVSSQEQVRYGLFGWLRAGPVVLMGEAGWGTDVVSSTSAKKNVRAVYLELNWKLGNPDSYSSNLMLIGKFDYGDSDYQTGARQRYTLGLEWFLKSHLSVGGEYRFVRENPEIENDQALLLAHLWF